MKPDYKSYSLEELYDVKDHIDKDKYPERYQALLHEIALREAAVPTSEVIKPKRKHSNTAIQQKSSPQHFSSWQQLHAFTMKKFH
jgi:hypothetical protein